MDISQTDYGQIDIYNEYFKYLDPNTIEYSPLECIQQKKTYAGIFKNRILPIMVGSKVSEKHSNPLKIKGYFIINGLCYSINNILFKIKYNFNKYTAFLSDGTKIKIQDMFTYHLEQNHTKTLWHLPRNWEQIVIYSKFKKQIKNHLTIISKTSKNKYSKDITNEQDLIALTKMFECWLDLINEPEYNFRLITPGEILYDCIDRDINIIDCFNNSKWNIKHLSNVTSVSELMKHYNMLHDIESIRRVTYPTNRKTTRLPDRQVKFNNMYKLCPAQSPDGELCGTVHYLTKDAKITIKDIHIPHKSEISKSKNDNIFLYINGYYYSKVSKEFIEKYFKNCDTVILDNIYFISTLKGRIIPSKYIISYTVSFIPQYLHNPPVRTTFACSMLKQAITKHHYSHIISDTKTLLESDTIFGNNLLIAIMPYKGFNIEDSIVISKSAAEKYKYKKIYIYRKKNDVKYIDFKLKIGQKVKQNQLLYKLYNESEIQKIEYIYSKHDGIITKIENEIIIESIRSLEVGDKMTSKHGQKGVISLIENDLNMPYIIKNNKKQYIELIINPHAFPSRMTMGQIKEIKETKCTVYINEIKIEKQIYVGICEYLALRHQVCDKIQYYNKAPINPITKQPESLRFGQMERDILIGLGAVNTLKELWSIDKTNSQFRQSSLICLSYLNALGYDIKFKNDKYLITEFKNKHKLPKCDETKFFGTYNVRDLQTFQNIVILPICLRSPLLEFYYKKSKLNIKEINKEIKRLLISKEGAFHKYFEGHLVNHSMRSVITPDPTLNMDEITIPIGINLGVKYCILNRQPSLNISSMKLMKIKYKKEKTISFNPLLCKSFNADFDGDEMNLYGISDPESIKELDKVLSKETHLTQDYILMKYLSIKNLTDLTYLGLTPDKEGISLMIRSESKGKQFNFTHIFETIGSIKYNKKQYMINSCYHQGLTENEWYVLCMVSRNNTASIALNTPISGYLQSLTNQLLL